MRACTGVLSVLVLGLASAGAAPAESRLFELRTYYANPGKLESLQARFRDHTVALFEKHGITNVGYWVPDDNPDNKLVYLLAFPDQDARAASWKAFGADPDWAKARTESEKDGRLVAKVESVFLAPTDFSPAVTLENTDAPRAFEWRIYTAAPGALDALLARFRDHTVALFAKHGITQIGYWTPTDPDKGADTTLIYLLAHKSREAAAESFKAFREDPAWQKARKDSEEAFGGGLTVRGGVTSTFMTATDYSPLR